MKDLSSFLTPVGDLQGLNKDICNKMKSKVKLKQKHCQDSTLAKIEDSLQEGTTKLGRKPKSLANKYQTYFNDCVDLDKLRLMNRDVEDILVGVSRLNWYRPTGKSIPLSVKKLTVLFKDLEVFSVKAVAESLEVGTKQGERYFKACSLVSFHLDRIENLPYIQLQDDYYDTDSC